MTASNTNYLVDGTEINEALKQLVECGADVVGLNCHHGPHHMQRSFSHIELPEQAYLSCYPNASLLDIENVNLNIVTMRNISATSHKNSSTKA